MKFSSEWSKGLALSEIWVRVSNVRACMYRETAKSAHKGTFPFVSSPGKWCACSGKRAPPIIIQGRRGWGDRVPYACTLSV